MVVAAFTVQNVVAGATGKLVVAGARNQAVITGTGWEAGEVVTVRTPGGGGYGRPGG